MSDVLPAPSTARTGATSVAIVTLGCGRNEVDSDQLAGLFHREGMAVVEEVEDADVVLVNTCTFIAPAKQESIDTVLAACDLKDGRARAVVVVGCMAERYPNKLAAEIPEADAVVGFDGYARLPQLVDDILGGRPFERVIKKAVTEAAATTSAVTNPALHRDLPLLVMPTTAEEAPPEAAPLPERPLTLQALDRMPASGPRFPVRRFDGRPWAYLKIASAAATGVCTFCAIPSFPWSVPIARASTRSWPRRTWLVDEGAHRARPRVREHDLVGQGPAGRGGGARCSPSSLGRS